MTAWTWSLVALAVAAIFGIWLGHAARRDGGEGRSVPEGAGEEALARHGHCVLCDGPLRRAATPDEVMADIQRRIDAESLRIAERAAAARRSGVPPALTGRAG